MEQLLIDLRQGLVRLYGPRLDGLWLFGSYARGEADAESDVEVLVVLIDLDDYGSEVERTSSLARELGLRYGPSVNLVFTRLEDWSKPSSAFLAAVRREAITA